MRALTLLLRLLCFQRLPRPVPPPSPSVRARLIRVAPRFFLSECLKVCVLAAALLLQGSTALGNDFPKPFNSGTDAGKSPMPASEAVKQIAMPAGFKATVFASEPDVQNPIACAWDSRGRLWVAENYTYADSKTNFDKTLRDRILIFEDTDHDGKADKRTVFHEGLQNLTSIELGYGGVYATAAPRLVFIPDENGDDKPDGDPETLLDGFDAWSVRHNFVNGLKWGPDGWLWGRHGIQATSKVGAPGTPENERTKINCCIWRFHPVRKTFEVVCWGGTNSWGHDWTAEGEGFFINTVIGHAYHIIPGAHYERMYGQDLNPHIYQLLPQSADHYHFDTGKGWTNSRDGKANDLGGGHAHSGCMIYLGQNWPEQYRGKLYTLNLHGRRINVERIVPKGSSYILQHEPDMIHFGDPWFRGVELTYGPDGGVYVLDWSDQGECHENDGVHRESGRIYKIMYGEVKKADLGEKGDLAKVSNSELLAREIFGTEWEARFAIRLFRERLAVRPFTEDELKHIRDGANAFAKFPEDSRDLTHDQVYRLDRLRFLTPKKAETIEERRQRLKLAAIDSTGNVDRHDSVARRMVCSELQGMSPEDRLPAMFALLFSSGDNDDPVLPMLYWATLEPVVACKNAEVAEKACDFAYRGTIRIVLQNAARRYASDRKAQELRLVQLLGLATADFEAEKARLIITGMSEGLRGQAKADKPNGWDAFAGKAGEVLELAGPIRKLSALFGDGRALDEIRQIALDSKADLKNRQQALESLVAAKPADLRTTLDAALKDGDLLPHALAALAQFDDAGPTIIASYKRVRADSRPAVMAALASRPAFALALLDAVQQGQIPRADVTPYHARQIAGLKNAEVSKRLAEVWGTVATSSAEKKARIAELKKSLTPDVLKAADLAKGRELFTQTCGACHTLYDLGQQGTNLGPNLTGSGRDNLDYLLENIVDPNAVVPADYKLSTLTLKDGRTLSGFISAQTDQTLTLRTMTETQTLPRADVTKSELGTQSLMPESLLDALTPDQCSDLIAFLMKK